MYVPNGRLTFAPEYACPDRRCGLFFGVLEDGVGSDPLANADAAAYRALEDIRTGSEHSVLIAITVLGDTLVVVTVTPSCFSSSLGNESCVALHRARPGVGL
jgi:hypothetical protein